VRALERHRVIAAVVIALGIHSSLVHNASPWRKKHDTAARVPKGQAH
jgi:hypothetical protein